MIVTPKAQKYKKQQQSKQHITIRKGKLEDTLEQISKIEWNDIINLNNIQPQAQFDAFYDTINMIQDTCQPFKTITIKNEQPWMTPYIKGLIKQRQVLHHKKEYEEWRKMANIIKHHIKKRKQIYYNRFKNKDNKIWWKIVNDANGKNNKHQDTQFSAEQLNDGYHQVWNGLKQPDISKFDIINQGNLTPTNIKLNGQTLEQVKNDKYLGVLINDELDYNVQ